ncbi:MAG: NUDIX domain-containing protein [Rikenellaceae bacterium]|nr:NUDIX domain-containing protein [Rikenellaceae bacterium]
MYTVYYSEKRIVFDVSEDKYNNCNPIFHLSRTDIFSSRTALFDLLAEHDTLVYVCDDIERAFASFCDLFNRVTAAGGVVTDAGGRTLMIFRNGRWDIPKGKREPGESIEECAVREVGEECGIDGHRCGDLITVTWHLYLLGGEMILKDTYWFEMSYDGPAALTPQREEGISDIKWCTPAETVANVEASYYTIKDLFAAKSLATGRNIRK